MKKVMIIALIVISLVSFSFTRYQERTFGIRINNPVDLKNDILPKPEFIDNLILYYGYQKNIDSQHNSPVSYGFGIYSNLDFDNEYIVRGASFDFAVKVFGVTLFNEGEKLQLGFQGEVFYKKEIFQKEAGSSSNLSDFGSVSFSHYNKIIVNSFTLKPGVRADFIFSKDVTFSGRVYYNIQFFMGAKTETGKEVVSDIEPMNSIDFDVALNIAF